MNSTLNTNQTANNVLNVFQGFRMAPTPIDQYEQKGKLLLKEKIFPFLETNRPIDFVMLGYPMKSANDRDKVIGKVPDLAEEISLKNFASFNEQVKQFHAPGVRIHIVNDGYVFNDLLDVCDNVVNEYQERAEYMGRVAPMNWYNLKDFYTSGSLNEKREKLMGQFGISDIELEKRILLDPDVNFLYRGMIHFMEQELAVKEFASRNQLHKAAKKLTRDMMLRNEAYSSLVKNEFSEYIRLSMHPSVNNGAKYSFQLIPSPKAWTSPWHCALLVNKEGEFETIHKKDALAAGHELVYKDGQPYYYKQN